MPVWALADPATIVPMAGTWDGDRFVPTFPLAADTTYAVLARVGEHWSELRRFSGPVAPQRGTTRVVSIEPGVAEVPENLLRFSVTFSAPIEEGSVAGRVRLLDARDTELPGTLLAMPPELWDRSHRRLTVLLEPGRIKRGLVPNLELGPPLLAGSPVTFVVDGTVRDAEGAELAEGARRSFTVGTPVRSRIDPGLWRIDRPEGALDDLVVTFDRPLDRTLVARCLSASTPGTGVLYDGGLRWVWRPSQPWADVALRVDPDLEDLAGNSVRRAFDRDVSAEREARGARPGR